SPVTVIPNPAWFSDPNVLAKASWISPFAKSSGVLDGYGDAVYRINFTLSTPGLLFLQFTGDDLVEIYVDGVLVATQFNLAALNSITMILQPGQHVIEARVYDTGGTVSGFLAYGWVCNVSTLNITLAGPSPANISLPRPADDVVQEGQTLTETVTGEQKTFTEEQTDTEAPAITGQEEGEPETAPDRISGILDRINPLYVAAALIALIIIIRLLRK
ncbi:MAG: hypothetical protein LRS43_02890, partial [Desulfurococcales archaeon]|nr:hypothetical protein [Desulfurococcales archaeon]